MRSSSLFRSKFHFREETFTVNREAPFLRLLAFLSRLIKSFGFNRKNSYAHNNHSISSKMPVNLEKRFFSLQCMLRSSPNVKSEQKYQLCFFCTFALITQDETTSVNPSIHIFIAGYDYPTPLPPLGSSQVVLTTSHF